MATIDEIVELVEIPENAVITDAILVVAYIREDGNQGIKVLSTGKTFMTTHLGLLEFAKQSVLKRA